MREYMDNPEAKKWLKNLELNLKLYLE